MKKLLFFLSCLLLTGSISQPILAKAENENIATSIIDENGEKVSLIQSNVKKVGSDSPNEANIETTNVNYDLRYLFGGDDYVNYDLNNLIPNETNSETNRFKFYCAKPVGKNLYLYLYHSDNRNGEILNATFQISKSNTYNEEKQCFEESFINYNARFINSYGYKQRFMKFAIDNLVNSDDDVRFFINACIINYSYKDGSTYNSSCFRIQDEVVFKTGAENQDFMQFDYYKNDYVRILNADVGVQLVGDTPIEGIANDRTDRFYSYDENFYCFFNTDKKIDELKKVTYTYNLITYQINWNTGMIIPHEVSVYKNACYPYALPNEDNSNNYKEISVKQYQDSIESGTEVISVQRPYFFGWNQEVTYKQDYIIDLSDNGLKKVEDENAREWFKKYRTLNGVTRKHCFKIASTERNVVGNYAIQNFWQAIFGAGDLGSISECHDMKEQLILSLEFRSNNIDFKFNALDIPKDLSFGSIMYIPYETLVDKIINNVTDFWSWLKNLINNGQEILRKLLIVLAFFLIIILFISLYPFMSNLIKDFSSFIKNKKVKKENKRKKRKKRSKKKK